MKKRIAGLIFSFVFIFSLTSIQASANYTLPFETEANAVYLINLNSNKVLYEKNATERIFPASVTKIMTAVLVIESIANIDSETITVTEEMVNEFRFLSYAYSNCGLIPGEIMTVKDLLYAILLQSASDAANALAFHIGGGDRQVFVDMMNAKAAELGMSGTHFVNPHGLHDDEHYTTAYDLSLLAQYAIKLDYLLDISSEARHTFTSNLRSNQWLATTNLMQNDIAYPELYYSPVKGIKTGTTDEAGSCIVSIATKGSYTYLLVLMGEPVYDSEGVAFPVKKTFIEAPKFFEWAFNSFEIKSILAKDEIVEQVNVNLSGDVKRIHLKTANDINQLIPQNFGVESIRKVFNIPESIDAPVKEGDIIGTLDIFMADDLIASVDLYASETVERGSLAYLGSIISRSTSSSWFKFFILFFILAIASFVLLFIQTNNMRKRKSRRIRTKYGK